LPTPKEVAVALLEIELTHINTSTVKSKYLQVSQIIWGAIYAGFNQSISGDF
jgi:hypothetical protein